MQIFISWSGSLAKSIALKLQEEIEGIFTESKVFVSDNSINAGAEWRKTVIDHLNKADLSIYLLSHHSLKSSWVNFELGYSLARAKDGDIRIYSVDERLELHDSPFADLQIKPLNQAEYRLLIEKLQKVSVNQTIESISGKLDNIISNFDSELGKLVAKHKIHPGAYTSILDYLKPVTKPNYIYSKFASELHEDLVERTNYESGIAQYDLVKQISISQISNEFHYEERSRSFLKKVADHDGVYRATIRFGTLDDFANEFTSTSFLRITLDGEVVANLTHASAKRAIQDLKKFGSSRDGKTHIYTDENGVIVDIKATISKDDDVELLFHEQSILSRSSTNYVTYHVWPTHGFKLTAHIAENAKEDVKFVSLNGPMRYSDDGAYHPVYQHSLTGRMVTIDSSGKWLVPGEIFKFCWEYNVD